MQERVSQWQSFRMCPNCPLLLKREINRHYPIRVCHNCHLEPRRDFYYILFSAEGLQGADWRAIEWIWYKVYSICPSELWTCFGILNILGGVCLFTFVMLNIKVTSTELQPFVCGFRGHDVVYFFLWHVETRICLVAVWYHYSYTGTIKKPVFFNQIRKQCKKLHITPPDFLFLLHLYLCRCAVN